MERLVHLLLFLLLLLLQRRLLCRCGGTPPTSPLPPQLKKGPESDKFTTNYVTCSENMRHKISNITDIYLSVCYTPFSGLTYDIRQWAVDEGDPAKRLAASKKGIALDLCSLQRLRRRIFWRAVEDTYLLEKEHSVNVSAHSPCWRNVRKRYYAKHRKPRPHPGPPDTRLWK